MEQDSGPKQGGRQQEAARCQQQERIRGHTQVVRNWGYYRQSLSILRQLYAPLDSLLHRKDLLAASSLISVFEFLNGKAETFVNDLVTRLGPVHKATDLSDVANAYGSALDLPQHDSESFVAHCAENGLDADQAKYILTLQSFECLREAFTRSIHSDGQRDRGAP